MEADNPKKSRLVASQDAKIKLKAIRPIVLKDATSPDGMRWVLEGSEFEVEAAEAEELLKPFDNCYPFSGYRSDFEAKPGKIYRVERVN